MDCLLKTNPSKKELDAILDEIISDEVLLGYNFNSLHKNLSKLIKDGDTKKLKHLRKKLQSSKILQAFLARKLSSKELGTLRKIDYYAFYRDMTGKTLPEVEDKIRQVAFKQFAMDIGRHDYDRRDYMETLLQSLTKHGLVGIKDLNTIVEQAQNKIILQYVANIIPTLSRRGSASEVNKTLKKIVASPKVDAIILEKVANAIKYSKEMNPNADKVLNNIIASPKVNRYALRSVAYAVALSRKPILGAEKILEKIITSPKSTGLTLASVAYAVRHSKEPIPNADKMLEKIMSSPKANRRTLQEVARTIDESKIPNAGEILEKIVSSPKASRLTLEIAVYALKEPKEPIHNIGKILEKIVTSPKANPFLLNLVTLFIYQSKGSVLSTSKVLEMIIDSPKADVEVLSNIRKAIKPLRLDKFTSIRLLKKLDKVEEQLRQ